jgi:hypothetical protein
MIDGGSDERDVAFSFAEGDPSATALGKKN